ncbi:MAG: NAD(P)H-dependent oxidoreductase [Acidimicrobiia bacterium]|nr:NAD(P)H-dependent oxidoreductase [Acidimicrobiia bacterium]
MTRIVTLCGSLSSRSANRAALDVATAAARTRGAEVDDFDHLADLPAFDPAGHDHPAVAEWRRRVGQADAVLVAAPEYAGGVAGAVKNAFDWLVGNGELYAKPVAVISAGTSGGEHARADLSRTTSWQGSSVVADLGIAAPRTKSDADGRITDEATLTAIEGLVDTLLGAISEEPGAYSPS